MILGIFLSRYSSRVDDAGSLTVELYIDVVSSFDGARLFIASGCRPETGKARDVTW